MSYHANRSLALIIVGLLLIVLGSFLSAGMATFLSGRSVRAEKLDPATAAQIGARTQGREVLVEGRVVAATPPGDDALAAFVRERQQNDRWVEVERFAPALTVAVTDGVVLIAPDYYLDAAPDAAGGEVRERALRIGDTATAIGAVVENPSGHSVEAELVFVGTREQYIEMTRYSGPSFAWIGATIAGIGAALALLGVLQKRRWSGSI